MSWEPRVLYSNQRPTSSVLEKKQSGCTKGVLKKLHCVQNGSPAGVTHLPWAREATCAKQEGANGEYAVSQDVQEGSCNSDRSVKEPLNLEDGSATRNVQKTTLRRYLAPAEWTRSHPVLTLELLILLVLLVVVVSLAAVSATRHRDTPVTPVNPAARVLLACPHGWVGYNGICYFLSRDRLSWDQAKARCFELEASLAVLKDWEMEFLFRTSRNDSHWLGLRRQDQRLQWVDGSNFSSSVPVLGNADCVHLAENYLRRQPCSNDMLYICSRPQTHL